MNWGNIVERALWTGVQAPAVVGIIDLAGANLPPSSLIWAAVLGFSLSALKSIAQDRLKVLNG